MLQRVLQIGSGGDYLVEVRELNTPIQLEVSGLREDATGHPSRSRLHGKTDQVLTRPRVGFVSVTTFAHGSGPIAHSYLHFVRQKSRKSVKPKPTKKPPGGKKGKKK